jgi:protein-tyrosine phosphatase
VVKHVPLLRTPWSADALPVQSDAASFLAARYLEMITGSASAIGEAIDFIADATPGPLVFHCAAGKDRTGILAAVILGLLGTEHDVIADDYQHSAAAMEDLGRLYAGSDPQGASAMVAQPREFMMAPREAMDVVLRSIRLDWGSMASYVIAAGASPDAIDILRANMVEHWT